MGDEESDYQLTRQDRAAFDKHLDAVMLELPPVVREWMDEIPLVVEDFPSIHVMRDLKLRHPEELCGLHVGRNLTNKFEGWSSTGPERVIIYRGGIIASADLGQSDEEFEKELRRQIRITILHEYGHHTGMDEDQLRDLGYG